MHDSDSVRPSSSASTAQHREAAASQQQSAPPIRACILTVSDTRTEATDQGGALIAERLLAHGCHVPHRRIVRDEPADIDEVLRSWLDLDDIDLVITTGGTGIARRDTTIEVVRRHLTAELEGFGELFRMISFEAIGPAAMLSRAAGGLAVPAPQRTGIFIFALPGSVHAVATALDRLILPELAHLIYESRRQVPCE